MLRAGRAPTTAFNASSLTGLHWSFRASNYSAGTLTDLSGNGRDATQATAGKRPTATTYNGKAALQFTAASSQWLGGTMNLSGGVITLYVVASTSAVAETILSCSQTAAPGTFNDGIALFRDNTGGDKFFARRLNGGDASKVADNSVHVFDMVFKAASGDIVVDGTAGTASAASVTPPTLISFNIGQLGGDVYFSNGLFLEAHCYAGEHNSTDRQTARRAIGAYYGITVA
jgi:hypothetical protein